MRAIEQLDEPCVRPLAIRVVERHEELGGAVVGECVEGAVVAVGGLGEREHLALPVGVVADLRCDGLDVVEPALE